MFTPPPELSEALYRPRSPISLDHFLAAYLASTPRQDIESLTIYADPNAFYYLPNALTQPIRVKQLTFWHPVLHNMQFYKEVLTSSRETLRTLRIMLYDPRVDLGEMLECVDLDRLEEV